MKTYLDRMLCVMPRSRELQFAAMPVLHSFLLDFQKKMAVAMPVEEPTDFILEYAIDMPEEDFRLFQLAGLILPQSPLPSIEHPDILLDFSDAILDTMKDTGRHASQWCGMLCGIQESPFPPVIQVRPRRYTEGRKWAILPGLDLGGYFPTGEGETIDPVRLLTAQDGEFSGVIGRMSWETYLSCSQGLPTIEIVRAGENRYWLSKWQNPLYRAISFEAAERDLIFYVNQARENLEMTVEFLAARAQK